MAAISDEAGYARRSGWDTPFADTKPELRHWRDLRT